MFSVPEFQSSADLVRHYRAVKARLNVGIRKPPVLARTEIGALNTSQDDRGGVFEAVITLADHNPEIEEISATPCCFVLDAVVLASGRTRDELLSARQSRALSRPRHVYFYLAKKYTTSSRPRIGRVCGGKDHSSVMHGARHVAADLESGGEIFGEMVALSEKIIAAWLQRESMGGGK